VRRAIMIFTISQVSYLGSHIPTSSIFVAGAAGILTRIIPDVYRYVGTKDLGTKDIGTNRDRDR